MVRVVAWLLPLHKKPPLIEQVTQTDLTATSGTEAADSHSVLSSRVQMVKVELSVQALIHALVP